MKKFTVIFSNGSQYTVEAVGIAVRDAAVVFGSGSDNVAVIPLEKVLMICDQSKMEELE